MATEFRGIIQKVKDLGLLQTYPSPGQILTGTHTSGSEHYAGRAVDFGQSTNPSAAIYDALVPLANYDGCPIDELFYDPSGHGWKNGQDIGPIGGHSDHVHVGVRAGINLAQYTTTVEQPPSSDMQGKDPFGDAVTKAGGGIIWDTAKATVQITEALTKVILWLVDSGNQKRMGMFLIAFLVGLEALLLVKKGLG